MSSFNEILTRLIILEKLNLEGCRFYDNRYFQDMYEKHEVKREYKGK